MDVYDILDLVRVDMGGGNICSFDSFCGGRRAGSGDMGSDLHSQILAAIGQEVADGR